MCVKNKPGLLPLGPHVRFRRGQTLVREGSPLVKPRNSSLVPFSLRLGMRCRLSPTAAVPSRTSGQLCAHVWTYMDPTRLQQIARGGAVHSINNGLPSLEQAFARKRCVGHIMAPGMKQRMSIRNGLPSVHSYAGQTIVRPARFGSLITACSGTSHHSRNGQSIVLSIGCEAVCAYPVYRCFSS
jgi:hypothetical protein